MQIPNLYVILGLDSKATMEDIRKAYRRLGKEWHPDVNKSPEAEEKFKEIKEAYNIIGDEKSRKEYDEDVALGSTHRVYGPSFESVFATFFSRARTAASPVDGTDITVKCKFFVRDVITAMRAQKTVKFIRKGICPDCNGQAIKVSPANSCAECGGTGSIPRTVVTPMGAVSTSVTCGECKGLGKGKPIPCSRCAQSGSVPEDAEATFFLPPYTVLPPYAGGGIYTLRILEQGNAGREGGKNGNLIVELEHDPTDCFEIQRGFDVVAIHSITLREAITGGKTMFRLPHGEEVEMPIRAGASEGERVSFPGQGLYDGVTGKRGDCYAEFHVLMPSHMSDKDLTKISTILKSYE
jgi:molecular chaperone DnaJ